MSKKPLKRCCDKPVHRGIAEILEQGKTTSTVKVNYACMKCSYACTTTEMVPNSEVAKVKALWKKMSTPLKEEKPPNRKTKRSRKK